MIVKKFNTIDIVFLSLLLNYLRSENNTFYIFDIAFYVYRKVKSVCFFSGWIFSNKLYFFLVLGVV